MDIKITPSHLEGTVCAPPSKSHAHRLMVALALSGHEIPKSFCTSADTKATRNALSELHNGGKPDCGESGTTLRFLLPVAAALGANVTFTGHGRLPERPMAALTNTLRENGAKISADNLPISVSGKLRPGTFTVPGFISSQFISGLLFALPLLDNDSEIIIEGKRESAGYIDMTLKTLSDFSIKIKKTDCGFKIKGNQKYIKPEYCPVEGDWSNAAFFICMNELGNDVIVTGLDKSSLQCDRAVLEILGSLGKGEIDISQCPDLFPVLAVTACGTVGDTKFVNAERLRIKESDRIAAVEEMINALGGNAESTESTLTVHGTGRLSGGEIDSANDHRIVMAATTAACICSEPVIIHGAQAVEKSYPDFFEDYKTLGGKADVI